MADDRADGDRLLELLLHETADVRDDERSMSTQYALLLPAALLLIGAMATLIYQTCAAGYPTPDAKLTPVPIWIYVGAPMLPIVLVSYIVLISTTMTLRSYYMRVIERRIHKLTDQLSDELPIPSWAHVTLEVTGPARSRWSARLNWLLIFGIVALMLLVCVYLVIFKIPDIRYRIFALAIDGALIVIPVSASALNIASGLSLWKQALAALPRRLHRTDTKLVSEESRDKKSLNERSLTSYLLLPRNQEELLKALFIPTCFLIGRWLAPGIPRRTPEMTWHLIGFFFVFEFLIYQARYLLNDVRDRRIDCFESLSKRRFPCSWMRDKQHTDSALRAAFASFVARWVMAGLVVRFILPTANWKWLWHSGFLLGIFVIALAYEIVRSKCNAAAAGRSRNRMTAWGAAIVSVVGLGYGLRSVVGLWLAGVDDKGALVLLAFGASLFGSMFVALTWALESTRADEADLAKGKGHLVWFRKVVSGAAGHSHIAMAPSNPVLTGRQSLIAPWCVTAVLATGVLFSFALFLLRDRFSDLPITLHLFGTPIGVSEPLLIGAAVVGIAAVAVVSQVRASLILTVLNSVGVGLVLHLLSVPVAQGAIAAIVVALPLIVTCVFRRMCFNDLPGVMDKLIHVAGTIISFPYLWFTRAR